VNHIIDNIYIGDSHDARNPGDITCLLNCAYDLDIDVDPSKMLYVKVALRDAIDNALPCYEAAALILDMLSKRHKKVLVFCHEGFNRSVAVVVLWLVMKPRYGASPLEAAFRRCAGMAPHEHMLTQALELVRQKRRLPDTLPHERHIKAIKALTQGKPCVNG